MKPRINTEYFLSHPGETTYETKLTSETKKGCKYGQFYKIAVMVLRLE